MDRSVEKFLYHPVSKIIASIVFCFVVLVGLRALITKPIFHLIIPQKNIADPVINYISSAGLLLSYFYFFRFYEKRKIIELSAKNGWLEVVGGFLFGFSILSLVILILYLSGHYSILNFAGLSYLLAPFSALVTAVLFEEIVFRLIIYRILEEWKGTYFALFVIVIVFTIPHLFNNGLSLIAVLIIPAFSFIHGLMYTYTKTLWLPFAFHLGWNFAQPFYGSNLSGEKTGHLINAVFEGPVLIIGNEFGIEDSIYTLISLVLLCFAFLYLTIKKGKIITQREDPSPDLPLQH